MKNIRVVLADDHTLVRAGLRALLQSFDEIEVVGEVTNGLEAIQAAARLRPDIILMDISMPEMNGLQATARIVQEYSNARIIILSMHINEAYVLQALNSGASGYLLKKANTAELEIALKAVAKGEKYFSSSASTHVVNYMKRRKQSTGIREALTARQRQILQMIAEGFTGKEIGAQLNISVRTVEGHRAQIMDRLGIHDVAGLVRYAIRTGLVEPEPT